MKRCNKCSIEYSDDTNFCTQCGSKVVDITTETSNAESSGNTEYNPYFVETPLNTGTIIVHSTDSERSDTQNIKKRRNGWLVLGILLAVILLAGGSVFAWWLISRSEEDVAPVTDTVLSAEEIYTSVSPSVVEIQAKSGDDLYTGSGFFLDDMGTVVTNYHVIEYCQSAKIYTDSAQSYDVISVLGYDADRDIAILATKATDTAPLTFRETAVKTGESVFALGSSLGLTSSLSDGIVSAVNREVEGNIYIQTTAAVSQGNSGGPLVDSTGKVIGIIYASFTEGQNLNLAIPIADLNSIARNKNVALNVLFPKPKQVVTQISNCRFQYYADENKYVLMFQLTDEKETPIAAEGKAWIRIVNENNTTVYDRKHSFFAEDFEEWLLDGKDRMYVTTIYLSPSSIIRGNTENGTVYFKVFGEYYLFEDRTISAFDLPINPALTQPQYTCKSAYCNNAITAEEYYCYEHRCATSGCNYEREYGSFYCILCSCLEIGCHNSRIAGGDYCYEHKCITPDCTMEKEYGSNYCMLCECHTPGCHKRRMTYENGLYCVDHTCIDPDCISERLPYSYYCSFHEKYPY
ncbi:MAG: serine protease [Ruminococcaceae bacterium]|nr:serine protease [Oscillospiraceae bacterium]